MMYIDADAFWGDEKLFKNLTMYQLKSSKLRNIPKKNTMENAENWVVEILEFQSLLAETKIEISRNLIQ